MPAFTSTATWTRLVGIGPHDGAHRIAGRAAVSILVPLLVLDATGHMSWSMYAAFGAFTSLYGRERAGWRRTRLQLVAGLIQTACVTLGALVAVSDERRWLAIPVAAAVAGVAAWESARMGWHPPGSLFQVFGFASVASVPGTYADLGPAALCSGAAALFALVVGAVGALWRRDWREPPARPIGGAAGSRLSYAMLSAGGVLIAGLVATGAGIGRPYWAMVGAVVPLAASGWQVQVTRGIHRLVGTAAGLVLAWLLLLLDVRGVLLVLVVAVLQAVAELLVGRNYALALVAITPLALLMVHLAAPVPVSTILGERGLETLIGVVIGLLLGWFAVRRSS